MGFSPGEKQKVLKRIAALESKVEGLLSAKAAVSKHDYPVAGKGETKGKKKG